MIRRPSTHYAGVPIGSHPTIGVEGIPIELKWKISCHDLGFEPNAEILAWRAEVKARNAKKKAEADAAVKTYGVKTLHP